MWAWLWRCAQGLRGTPLTAAVCCGGEEVVRELLRRRGGQVVSAVDVASCRETRASQKSYSRQWQSAPEQESTPEQASVTVSGRLPSHLPPQTHTKLSRRVHDV